MRIRNFGVHLVKHHYGYSAFTVDLTGKLKPGRDAGRRLAGAGSGHPMRPESLQSDKVTSFHGRAVATVQSTAQAGAIELIVSAQGLEPQRVTIQSTSD